MRAFVNRKKNPDYKNPLIAAILSGIIPGAGKIYSKRYEDGLVALVLTGLFTYLGYDNLNANHDFRGWLFTSLAFGFYAGNIYGSAASVQIYNANVDYELNTDIDEYLEQNNYFLPPKIDFDCR
jgi:TM2 domain-containing membrane protein YozV